MKIPIKLNRFKAPIWIGLGLTAVGDPRSICQDNVDDLAFDGAISSIKIDDTWKSTSRLRHIITDDIIIEKLSNLDKPVILEAGSSSGATSVDLIEKLGSRFAKFFVSDRFLSVRCMRAGSFTYFYHPINNKCILAASDMIVVYADNKNGFFPLNLLAQKILSMAPRYEIELSFVVSMLDPRLRSLATEDARIDMVEYDMFDSWPYESLDLIKVANVLNLQYFGAAKIKVAVLNFISAMKVGGFLVLTDNRAMERVTVFRKAANGEVIEELSVGGGAEAAALV